MGVVILRGQSQTSGYESGSHYSAFGCWCRLPHLYEMNENLTERKMFLPETVAYLCPLRFSPHPQSFSSYFSHQPFLSRPLRAAALIIHTSFTFVSSVSIHPSASLSAFSVPPHLAHPSTSSSLVTAAGSSRGVWCVCVCVYCCAE